MEVVADFGERATDQLEDEVVAYEEAFDDFPQS